MVAWYRGIMVAFKQWENNMLTPSELGNRVRQLRNKHNKSQEELGQALGRSHAAISDIERGVTNLSVTDLSKIAQFFGVSVNEILEESPVHFRTAKNISPEELRDFKKAAESFMAYVNQLDEGLDKDGKQSQ